MPPGKVERLDIRSSDDVVRVRQQARGMAIEAGLSLVDQTKIITAASELARNALEEPIGATPAIVEGTLYVRTENHLYAFANGK